MRGRVLVFGALGTALRARPLCCIGERKKEKKRKRGGARAARSRVLQILYKEGLGGTRYCAHGRGRQ